MLSRRTTGRVEKRKTIADIRSLWVVDSTGCTRPRAAGHGCDPKAVNQTPQVYAHAANPDLLPFGEVRTVQNNIKELGTQTACCLRSSIGAASYSSTRPGQPRASCRPIEQPHGQVGFQFLDSPLQRRLHDMQALSRTGEV